MNDNAVPNCKKNQTESDLYKKTNIDNKNGRSGEMFCLSNTQLKVIVFFAIVLIVILFVLLLSENVATTIFNYHPKSPDYVMLVGNIVSLGIALGGYKVARDYLQNKK